MTKEITALLIDDEEAARETLRNYLTKYCPEINILGEAVDVPSAVKAILDQKPELIFLDVEMPYGNAFDVLEQTAHIGYETIFITAFSEYAIQALNFSAAYYILKPVEIEELIGAVNKAKENRNKLESTTLSKVLHENLKNPENLKLVLPTTTGFDIVFVRDIIRLSGSGNYTEIYLKDGQKKVVSKVLRYFQDLLETNGFMRVHKSHIIGMEYIKSYHRGRGGQVTMTDGVEIEVSPSKKAELLAYFSQK